jgi:hypothetical protein
MRIASMHLGSETLGLIGIHYPYYSLLLGYLDVLDPYSCTQGTVWCKEHLHAVSQAHYVRRFSISLPAVYQWGLHAIGLM